METKISSVPEKVDANSDDTSISDDSDIEILSCTIYDYQQTVDTFATVNIKNEINDDTESFISIKEEIPTCDLDFEDILNECEKENESAIDNIEEVNNVNEFQEENDIKDIEKENSVKEKKLIGEENNTNELISEECHFEELKEENSSINSVNNLNESDDDFDIFTGSDEDIIDIVDSENIELSLESDEECLVFDFSNCSAEDVLRAAENNKLISENIRNLVDVNETSNRKIILNLNNETSKDKFIAKNNTSVVNKNIQSNVMKLQKQNQNANIKIDNYKKTENIPFKKFGLTDKELEIVKRLILFKCRGCETLWDPNSLKTFDLCPECEWKLVVFCKTCSGLFYKLTSALNHIIKFHQNTKGMREVFGFKNDIYEFRCWKCSNLFKVQSLRDEHEAMCNMFPNFYCKFCSVMMSERTQLKLHLEQNHHDKFDKNELSILTNPIIEKTDLKKGIENLFVTCCLKCEQKMSLRERNSNCENCQTKLKYQCGHVFCNLTFVNLDDLILHVRRKHLYHGWMCRHCGCKFLSELELVGHQLNCGKPKKQLIQPRILSHKCQRCGRYFAKKCGLKVHIAFCKKNTVLYRCEHCVYRGYNKSRLISHLRYSHMHLFTNKLLRCVKCGTTWSNIYMLNDHLGNCSGVYSKEYIKQQIIIQKKKIKNFNGVG